MRNRIASISILASAMICGLIFLARSGPAATQVAQQWKIHDHSRPMAPVIMVTFSMFMACAYICAYFVRLGNIVVNVGVSVLLSLIAGILLTLIFGLALTSVNQLWIADLTYIRLAEEFVFLAAILDAYSRRVIGWALDRTLDDELTLTALRMAIACRAPSPGLVHHSDRGSQYASGDYIGLLQANQIRISMSRKAHPWDNAACESFLKTLKYEEVYRTEYRDLAEARASIGAFLEKVYNQKRLHSALGYLPPAEFERGLLSQTNKEAAARQFL